jgi:ATP-binding cassette, subfamily B, bacterial MsbA
VLWYGGRLALAGELPPGDLITFLLLTVTVAGSIGAFTGLYSQVQEAIGASRRVFELLDTAPDLPEPAACPRPSATCAARCASRACASATATAATTGCSTASTSPRGPGEVVALVGPSGAGKSTLVTLIPRFFDPVEGRVTLDGVDLRDLDPRALRGTSASCRRRRCSSRDDRRQRPLRAARTRATRGRGGRVAANADAFVRSFPDGYATLVGERGVKLSGGQRQRIAIARALLKDPRILVLDEATSSLDSESEALVQSALERLMRGRTTFVIAHRLSTVHGADRIVVIDGGRIVQSGRHADLMASGGLYADLYETQFRDVAAPA